MSNHRITIIHGPQNSGKTARAKALTEASSNQIYVTISEKSAVAVAAHFKKLATVDAAIESDTIIMEEAYWLENDPKGYWRMATDAMVGLLLQRKTPLHIILIAQLPMIDEWYHHFSKDGISMKVIDTAQRPAAQ